MSLSFYELGSPPPRVDNITVDAILERTKRDQTEFFTKLSRLVTQPWVRWGAVGVITCADARRERYVWHYGANVDPAVEQFIAEVESNPEEYLLIGNLAAHQFRLGLPPKCIVMTNEDRADADNVLYGAWRDPNLLSRFLGSELPELTTLRVQWNRYVSRVAGVTRELDDAIIYVPVVAQRPRGSREETILAGGLIWCVARDKVGEALARVAEAQLYLRWHLAELFGRNSFLGLSSDFIDIDHIIAEHGWFNARSFQSGRTSVPHNWIDFEVSRSPEELRRLAREEIQDVLNCDIPEFNEITHAALKQLYAGVVSLSALYLIGTIARQRTLRRRMRIEVEKLTDQALLPIRAKVGRKMISRHIRSNFFEFITATTISTRDSSELLERIDVADGALTVVYGDPLLAQEITYKLDRIFSGAEKSDTPHDTSGPLAEFILWSGSDFNSEECIYQHNNLCVLLCAERNGSEGAKSVLRLSVHPAVEMGIAR